MLTFRVDGCEYQINNYVSDGVEYLQPQVSNTSNNEIFPLWVVDRQFWPFSIDRKNAGDFLAPLFKDSEYLTGIAAGILLKLGYEPVFQTLTNENGKKFRYNLYNEFKRKNFPGESVRLVNGGYVKDEYTNVYINTSVDDKPVCDLYHIYNTRTGPERVEVCVDNRFYKLNDPSSIDEIVEALR